MSEWIAAGRVERRLAPPERPGARLLLAGGEERDQVERVARAAARPRRAPTRPPSRNAAASSVGSSASSASSARSIPAGPFSTAISGFVVSGSSPAGSSPPTSESGVPASTCGEHLAQPLDLGPQLRVARLRLLLDALEPAGDVVAVGDEQLELQVLEVAARDRRPARSRRARRAARRPAAGCRAAPARCRARPGRGSRPASPSSPTRPRRARRAARRRPRPCRRSSCRTRRRRLFVSAVKSVVLPDPGQADDPCLEGHAAA